MFTLRRRLYSSLLLCGLSSMFQGAACLPHAFDFVDLPGSRLLSSQDDRIPDPNPGNAVEFRLDQPPDGELKRVSIW